MDPRPTRTLGPALGGPSGRRGLTFVELLLVLVLLGILAAVALPTFGTGARSHSVVRQAREVHGALAQARTRAVAERRPHRFRIQEDGRFRLEARDDAGTWTPILISLPVAEPVAVVGGTGATVTFEPDGRAAAPATVTVGDPPSRHRIRVLAGGLLRWEGPEP
ncbi:MAG TPA: GspH/FimT family pseudopilin [Gemmatimonadota bacterium]|nr:GspH/FimT family pseudopilin [Gemmatimonadota bacterium]